METAIWTCIGALAGADFVLLPEAGLTGGGMGAGAITYLVVITAIGFALQHLGSRWARFPLAVAQFWLFAHFGGLLTYAAMAATPHPLADAMLARWDAAIGFDWVAWFHATRPFRVVLHHAYNSIFWQLLVLLALAGWRREPNRIDDLLVATILSVALVTIGMWFAPAVGAWSFHGVGVEPWRATILALHGHTLTTAADSVGIITFPSFHATCAVLLAWTARGWRGWFPLFVILNAAMAISAASEGAHYGVDVLAGLVVAGVAIALVWAMRSVRPLPAAWKAMGWRPRPAITT
jgi:hypothetical protein